MKRVRFKDYMVGTLTVTMADDTTIYLFDDADNYELDISDDAHAQILIDNGHFEEVV